MSRSFLVLAMPALAAAVAAPEMAITQDLVEEINSKQSSWTAHVSPRFANATVDDVKMLCGTILKGDPLYREALLPKPEELDLLRDETIPSDFDVRTNWPKCASVSGHIRDQSSCGSCWAFGSTEAFNDRRCIATGDTVLLSPEDTVSNCNFWHCFSMGCNGGHPAQAWKWFTNKGVVTGGDFDDMGKGDTCAPYSLQPCAHHVAASAKYPACPSSEYATPKIGSTCTESEYAKSYSADKKKASSSYSLSGVEKIQRDMMQYGSATGTITVYADFPTYQSGVYSHTSGKYLGGHAIKIAGWGTENGEDYWLIANSWNEMWGDHGFVKMKRGSNECGIESSVSAGTVSAEGDMVV